VARTQATRLADIEAIAAGLRWTGATGAARPKGSRGFRLSICGGTRESLCRAVENSDGSARQQPARSVFERRNCDKDATVADKISLEAFQTPKTPKKAAVAPVFGFTS
jgi:hypothetical protein